MLYLEMTHTKLEGITVVARRTTLLHFGKRFGIVVELPPFVTTDFGYGEHCIGLCTSV